MLKQRTLHDDEFKKKAIMKGLLYTAKICYMRTQNALNNWK